jgi:hypothetical protein
MTAAGVRPQTTGVIFRGRAFLEQHLIGGVEYENRKASVERPRAMDRHLLAGADLIILVVH